MENVTIHHLIRDTGIGPHRLAVALYGLVQSGWIGRHGDVVWITSEGRLELGYQKARRWDRLVCDGCGTLRFGLRHLALRAAGWCNGRGSLV